MGLKRTKQKTYLNFRLALFAGGFCGRGTLCQSVIDGLIGPVMVAHETERIRFVELVDLVQVTPGRVPDGFLRLYLSMIHLLCRCCRGDVPRIVQRRLMGGSRATGEGRVFVTAAAVTVGGRGSGERRLRWEWGIAPLPPFPMRWIVEAITQPFFITPAEFWTGWGNGRGTHPGEISARRQMRIIPGVDGEGRIIVVNHVLTVVEIVFVVVVVVVEKFSVATGQWWTFRRKRGVVNPKGGIHRMSGVGGFHQPLSGHR